MALTEASTDDARGSGVLMLALMPGEPEIGRDENLSSARQSRILRTSAMRSASDNGEGDSKACQCRKNGLKGLPHYCLHRLG
jgi:hypothetical protein